MSRRPFPSWPVPLIAITTVWFFLLVQCSVPERRDWLEALEALSNRAFGWPKPRPRFTLTGAIFVAWRVGPLLDEQGGNNKADDTKVPEGFTSLFNGKDLTGWDARTPHWKVEDGCLVGTTDGKLDFNRFIIWKGGTLKNFELLVKVKVTEGGNSGINYRSVDRPELGVGVITGYQCDVVANRPDYNGMLYEERGRRILAHTGEKVIIDTEGQPWVVDKLPVKEFKAGEWHDFRILVRGNHHQHWIDGHQTVDAIDLDEKNRKLEGILGVQVHVGPAMTIQYRDWFLKKLPDDLPIVMPDQAKIPADAVKVVPQGKAKKKGA